MTWATQRIAAVKTYMALLDVALSDLDGVFGEEESPDKQESRAILERLKADGERLVAELAEERRS